MGGVNLATAYVRIIPTVEGIQGNLGRMFGDLGDQAGGDFNQGFGNRDPGGSAGDSFLGGLKGKAMLGIAGIAAAVGAAFVDAYSEAVERRQSEAKAQASLGISPERAKELGAIGGRLYAQGYGEGLGELTDQVATVQSSLQNLKLPDAQLERITAKAISFGQAFDTDVSESIQSVGTLVQSGLVPDVDHAFDLITRSSQKVPEALRGDILASSDEYAQFFRTLGFSGDQAFDALVKGAEKGTFGIDKTGDAIKEFTIRSTDMSASSVAAYASIGLSAEDMSASILAGGNTANSAFQQIVDGILNIQDPTTQANTAIALFGTQMEDLNVADVPQFLRGLKGMSGSLGDVAGAADQMDSAMGSTTDKVTLFWRNLKTNLVDYISNNVLPAVTEATSWIGDKLGGAVQFVTAWLGDKLGPVVQKAGAFFRDDLVPFVRLAWSWFEENLLPTVIRVGQFIGDTIDNIVRVLGGIIDFVAGVFTGDWSRAWDGIKGIFGGIWDQIQNVVSTAWDVITGVGGKILDWASQLPGWLWEKISAFGGFLAEKGSQVLQWLWDGIVTKSAEVFDWFTSLPGWLWEKVAAAGSWLIDRGKDFLQWLWDGISAKANEVYTWFTSLPGWIWDKVAASASQLATWGAQFLQWIWDGITTKAADLYAWFTALPGTVWDKVAAGGTWLVDRGKEFIGWIGTGIADGAIAIWDWFIGLPARVWGFLSGLAENIKKIGSDFVNWIVDGIKGAAQAVADAISSLFNVQLNSEGTGYVAIGPEVAGGIVPGGARGAVVPGRDPGRRDNVLARLPGGGLFGLRSEEAIMVPEFTHAVGGEQGVDRLNRLAEAGLIGELMTLGGFARGGVAGYGQAIGRQASSNIAAAILKDGLQGWWDKIGDDVRAAAEKALGTAGVDPGSARGRFIDAMLSKQGTSYVWGAAGPNVFDCSGLVSWALEQAGVGKGRLTAEGFNSSFPKAAAAPGNLVTFDTGRLPGRAGHIGAIIDVARGLMMHTDGAGPARISDYTKRDGGPLNIVDAIGGGGVGAQQLGGILSNVKGIIKGVWNNAVGPSGEAVGGVWTRDQVIGAMRSAGFPASEFNTGQAISRAESGWNTAATHRNSNGSVDNGLWQINTVHSREPWYPSNVFDGLQSTKAAHALWSRAGGWRDWTVYNQGQYRQYLTDQGGWLPPQSASLNLLNRPEAVLTPPQSDALIVHAQNLARGFGGQLAGGSAADIREAMEGMAFRLENGGDTIRMVAAGRMRQQVRMDRVNGAR